MLGYWTAATDPNPFTQYLTQVQKYVVSRAPNPSGVKLDYPNSTLLTGEATHTVRDLKDRTDGNITILGSGELVRALHTAGMVDEYILQIHPIVLGQGTALFGAADRANLTLQRSVTTTTGVIIAQYSVTPVSSGVIRPKAATGKLRSERSEQSGTLETGLFEITCSVGITTAPMESRCTARSHCGAGANLAAAYEGTGTNRRSM